MRESRSYGSVRGVAGDRYPYRDFRREAVLTDCEFPGSGSWHTLALRN